MNVDDYFKMMERARHGTARVPVERERRPSFWADPRAKVNLACPHCNIAISLTLDEARAVKEYLECRFCYKPIAREIVGTAKITQP